MLQSETGATGSVGAGAERGASGRLGAQLANWRASFCRQQKRVNTGVCLCVQVCVSCVCVCVSDDLPLWPHTHKRARCLIHLCWDLVAGSFVSSSSNTRVAVAERVLVALFHVVAVVVVPI